MTKSNISVFIIPVVLSFPPGTNHTIVCSHCHSWTSEATHCEIAWCFSIKKIFKKKNLTKPGTGEHLPARYTLPFSLGTNPGFSQGGTTPFSHSLSTSLEGADAAPVLGKGQLEHPMPMAAVTSSGLSMRSQVGPTKLTSGQYLEKKLPFSPWIARLIRCKPGAFWERHQHRRKWRQELKRDRCWQLCLNTWTWPWLS